MIITESAQDFFYILLQGFGLTYKIRNNSIVDALFALSYTVSYKFLLFI